jgi:glycosyltransferase involved in cell wall biosynthesis
VGDFDRFKNVRSKKYKIPEDLKDIKKPIIGFTGAVDEYKFDRDLMRKVALDYPSYSFVIIGPVGLKDREASKKELGFQDLENVHLLGTKEFTELPKYVARFDVMIIPYQLNDYTVGGCFPVKFLNHLAAGLPTVVTDLPTYAPFEDVSYISKNPNEFSHNIRIALEEDSEFKIKQRQEVSKVHTWDSKVENMLSLIKDAMK